MSITKALISVESAIARSFFIFFVLWAAKRFKYRPRIGASGSVRSFITSAGMPPVAGAGAGCAFATVAPITDLAAESAASLDFPAAASRLLTQAAERTERSRIERIFVGNVGEVWPRMMHYICQQ